MFGMEIVSGDPTDPKARARVEEQVARLVNNHSGANAIFFQAACQGAGGFSIVVLTVVVSWNDQQVPDEHGH